MTVRETEDDWVSGTSGEVSGIRATTKAIVADAIEDVQRHTRMEPARLRRAAAGIPRRRVLVLAVERVDAPNILAAARAELLRSRHSVEVATTPIRDLGKFENLNELLLAHPAAGHDWLLVVDDDVALPRDFLDTFIFLAERFGLHVAQPAHRHRSHAAWAVTRQRRGSIARETAFVEIGPVFAFQATTFDVAAAVPGAAHRLGARRPLVGGRARPRVEARRDRRDAGAPRDPPCRDGVRPDRGRRGGAAVPRGASLREGDRGTAHARHAPVVEMRVLVLAEYYPRSADPVIGVWAHRQALAARDAGADIRVVVLHRPIPPMSAIRAGRLPAIAAPLRQPARTRLDGLEIDYVRYLSPPRPWSYESWGAWAAPALRRALRAVRAVFPFDLVHAHYAVPAGDAIRRAAPGVPLVVSVHGGDVHGGHAGSAAVRRTLRHARLVLANSAGTARRCVAAGARATRVVHLGADVPPLGAQPASVRPPALVTVAHLIARKRHADVIQALALLRERRADLRYVIVGEGPEAERLRALTASLRLLDRVAFLGQLPNAEATAVARRASIFVLPSIQEAFGVAYIEAMAAGIPAVGCRGEDGPEEIAAAGPGIALVPACDSAALAAQIDQLLDDSTGLDAIGAAARSTVQRSFTWERCGAETVQAYADVLGS